MRHPAFPASAYAYVAMRAVNPETFGRRIYSTPLATRDDMQRQLIVSSGNPKIASPLYIARFDLAEVEEWQIDQSDQARRAWEARRAR